MKVLDLNIQTILYNSSNDLPNYLKSLNTLVLNKVKVNVFLIDQSENAKEYNKIRELIKKYSIKNKNIKVVLEKQKNFGFGKGHNESYKRNKNEYKDSFIIINPDILFFYDLGLQLTKYLEQFKDKNWGLLELQQFPNEHPKLYDSKTLETKWASGAGLIINKKAFEEVGMFDENIFMYGEDVDLSIQMQLHDYGVYTLPEAKFAHITTDTDLSKDSPFLHKHKQAANLYLYKKYGRDKDVERYRKLLKDNKLYTKDIDKLYNKMIKNIDKSFYRKFVEKDGDYTQFRWMFNNEK